MIKKIVVAYNTSAHLTKGLAKAETQHKVPITGPGDKFKTIESKKPKIDITSPNSEDRSIELFKLEERLTIPKELGIKMIVKR